LSAPTARKDRREVAKPPPASRVVLALAPPLALVILAAAAALAMHWMLFDVLLFPKRTDWLKVGAWASLALAVVLAWWENQSIPLKGLRLPPIYFAFTALLWAGLAPSVPTAQWLEPLGFTRGSVLLLGVAIALFVALGLVRLNDRSARVRALLGFVIAFLLAWAAISWRRSGGRPTTCWRHATAARRARASGRPSSTWAASSPWARRWRPPAPPSAPTWARPRRARRWPCCWARSTSAWASGCRRRGGRAGCC